MRKLSAALLIGAACLVASPAYAQMTLMGVGIPKAVGGGGGGYSGPGDLKTYGLWYGTYAYSAATRGTNAVQVCDGSNANCTNLISDATTGIVANPTLGGTACNTTTNICTIKTWYDQTGNGFDQTNATAANRAVWKPAGNCQSLGASLSCGFSTAAGSTQYETAGTYSRSSPYTFTWVARRDTGTGVNNLIFNDAIGGAQAGGSDGNVTFNNWSYCASNAVIAKASTDGAWQAVGCSVNGASSNMTVESTNGTGDAGNLALSGTIRFLFGAGGRYWAGYVASAGIANSNFSTSDLAAANAASKTILGY